MTHVSDAVRGVPRALARILAIAGLSLAAVAADASAAAAQHGPLGQVFGDPALSSYRLTSDNLGRFLTATRALQALEGENVEMQDKLDFDDPEKIRISDIAAAFDGEPRVKAAINGAGMTSRDYVTFLLATMQAMFGSIAVAMGGDQALADMPDGVLKQNIRFFMDHQDEFQVLDRDG